MTLNELIGVTTTFVVLACLGITPEGQTEQSIDTTSR